MWTIPNILTLVRVLAIPVFVVIYFLDWRWAHEVAALVFCLAAITDWFDGYLARKLGQSTPFGAFLDPVADKLIVGAALLMITHTYNDLWITLPSILLLAREIFVSALREWMASAGHRDTVKVSFIGKAKTMTQMLALIGLLSGLEEVMGFPLYWVSLGKVLLLIATFLSVWSMAIYLKAAWRFLKG